MSSLSIWHWIIIVALVLPTWLFYRVVPKAGFSAWWALLGLVPGVNLIALWVFAFVEWPTNRQRL